MNNILGVVVGGPQHGKNIRPYLLYLLILEANQISIRITIVMALYHSIQPIQLKLDLLDMI